MHAAEDVPGCTEQVEGHSLCIVLLALPTGLHAYRANRQACRRKFLIAHIKQLVHQAGWQTATSQRSPQRPTYTGIMPGCHLSSLSLRTAAHDDASCPCSLPASTLPQSKHSHYSQPPPHPASLSRTPPPLPAAPPLSPTCPDPAPPAGGSSRQQPAPACWPPLPAAPAPRPHGPRASQITAASCHHNHLHRPLRRPRHQQQLRCCRPPALWRGLPWSHSRPR